MKIQIDHIRYRDICYARVFDTVCSYDDMEKAITTYGRDAACLGKFVCKESGCLHDDTYENRIGWAFEVYCEAFFKTYGMCGAKSPNYIEAGHSFVSTSRDKWHTGFDCSFIMGDGRIALVQVKFRSDPSGKFTRHDLGTFTSKALTLAKRSEQIPEMILFTNLRGPDIFTHEYADGIEQMRVFGRVEQEAYIDRDSGALELLTLR